MAQDVEARLADPTPPKTVGRGPSIRFAKRLGDLGTRATQRVVEYARGLSPWHWGLYGLISLYVAVMTDMSLTHHHGLGTSTYDMGIFEQGTWLLSEPASPFVTLRGIHLFGDHASYVLLLLAPIYAIFPASGTLFFLQALGIGLGALPVFLYARQRLGSEPIAMLMGAVFLLHPSLSQANMFDFHPDAFLPTFVGFALYGALTARWRIYTVFVVLALLVKEDVVLVIVPLGAWVAWRRDRVIGLLTIGWSVVFTLFAAVIAMQYFNAAANAFSGRGDRIPFGGVTGLVKTALTRPGDLWDFVRSDRRGWYLWQMSMPFAWLFVRLPEVAAIAGLVVLGNVLSLHGYQHQIGFHYSFVVVTVLAFGTVYALGAFTRFRRQAVAAVVVMALWMSFLWGTLPGSRDPRPVADPDNPRAVAAREVFPLIPSDAAVSAYTVLTPHLAQRRMIYMYPNPFAVHYYGPAGTIGEVRLPESDSIEYVVIPVVLPEGLFQETWDRERVAFTRVFANAYWEVWQRSGGD